MSKFFERLLSERKRLGLNQADFAALGGVSVNAQFNYEKGTRKPDTGYLEAIAIHGVDVPFLLTGQRTIDPHKQRRTEWAGSLGERLKQERQRLGLSQTAFGEKLGVIKFSVLSWEQGELEPNAKDLRAMYELGVDVGYVLLGIGNVAAPDAGKADEHELLEAYRAAPDAQTKKVARKLVRTLVEGMSEK